jgi:hypothetical protein
LDPIGNLSVEKLRKKRIVAQVLAVALCHHLVVNQLNIVVLQNVKTQGIHIFIPPRGWFMLLFIGILSDPKINKISARKMDVVRFKSKT